MEKAKQNIQNESSKSSVSSPPLIDTKKETKLLSLTTRASDQGVKVIKYIREEEGICKVCNNVLREEEEGVIMSNCECTFALMHQQCAIHQSKNIHTENTTNCCDVVCHQIIHCRGAFGFCEPLSLRDPWETYGTMERQEDEFLIVKIKSTQGQVEGKQEEKVHKQEAICRSCSDTFEQDNVVMTKCECKPFTLIHEDCAKKLSDSKGNNKCDVCGQDAQDILVILKMPQLSSTSITSEPRKKNWLPSCFRG